MPSPCCRAPRTDVRFLVLAALSRTLATRCHLTVMQAARLLEPHMDALVSAVQQCWQEDAHGRT